MRGLMVCGTASNAGKTTIVAGLCRLFARRGFAVAPFKAQNMALNSAVTAAGHEIGRAQFWQAQAAGIVPTVDMNPVLVKPTGGADASVVVMGKPLGDMTACDYGARTPELFPLALASLDRLRAQYDVVIVEGAGSAAEINLAETDIANMRLAERANLPAVLVGDIDLGGVFASLYGTVALLGESQRRLVRGFVINKLRGDPEGLGNGTAELERRCGVPTLGVLPMLDGLLVPDEDSVALGYVSRLLPPAAEATLDVAVVQFPRLSNFTDFDPLLAEPEVNVRFVRSVRELGSPDLIVLGGSKATVRDLEWLRDAGLAEAVSAAAGRGVTVLGVCGGYQMLGRAIHDEVESQRGTVEGLGLLEVETRFDSDKVLAQRRGRALDADVTGYQIHHGRVAPIEAGAAPEAWLWLDGEAEGFCSGPADSSTGNVMGTSLHGLFDSDSFRAAFLEWLAARSGVAREPSGVRFAELAELQFDRLADALEAHLDIEALLEIAGLEG